MYVYVKVSHFALRPRLTQHCKSVILQLKKKKNSTGIHQSTEIHNILSGLFRSLAFQTKFGLKKRCFYKASLTKILIN